jgi:hypothetical protein
MAEISRLDLKVLDTPRPVSIAHIKHLASYSWIKGETPTIVVPGLPRLWAAPKGTQKLEKDSGFFYIAINAARHPDSPMEPLFRSLFIAHPSFDLSSIDVITDRNNIRKLLQFVNPGRGSYKLEPFTINVEVTKNTAILARTEVATSEVIGLHQFRGFGHQFESNYTTAELGGSEGHHRIISYRFCGMSFLVRHETDAYTKSAGVSHGNPDKLSDLLGNLSLASKASGSYNSIAGSKLRIGDGGHVVPLESTIEIKTRASHKPLGIDEVAPQLWVSQTPKLVRAYHHGGRFTEPKVEDVSTMIQSWEAANQSDLMKLGWLIKQIVSLAKEFGGKATVQCDVAGAKLIIQKTVDLAKILPEDLYARWNDNDAAREGLTGSLRPDKIMGTESAGTAGSRAESGFTPGKYLINDYLPFAAVIRSGIDKGFRQFFRDMPTNLEDYRSLCQSLKASDIDVLQGESVRELMGGLRSGKESWDPEDRCTIAGSKRVARDSAFRLLYAFLQTEVEDRNSAYNTTLFVVSHSRMFSVKTRKMVRQAFDGKFMSSFNQRRELDKWPVIEESQEDDATTDEEPYYDDCWDSDYS